MSWVAAHLGQILSLMGAHVLQAAVPLIPGLIVGLVCAPLVLRSRRAAAVILAGSSLLYTIPSLVLFVTLPALLGTRILDPINVIVALTLYTSALLVRTAVDALRSIDEEFRQVALALGYRPLKRFLTIDVPLALPVIFSGLRSAAVTNMSLVTVGALIGVKNLGFYFIDGLQRSFVTEIVVGIIATILLAVVLDGALHLAERLLCPWRYGSGPRRSLSRPSAALIGAAS